MAKQSLKDKVEDNELDMSMCELTSLPVDEMMKLTKVTSIDLSCNLLVTLPDDFCNLKHIVKLDLSKNYLSELPSNFGALSSLQHLDLLSNKLHILPLSFAELNRLKWLDLKNNPLDEMLQLAAGDCSDEAQCRKCAQNVIKFMTMANAEMEKQREREEIEREKQRKLDEAQRREAKRLEKEKKRQENMQHKKQKQAAEQQAKSVPVKEPDIDIPAADVDEAGDAADDTDTLSQSQRPTSSNHTWSIALVTTFAGLVSILVGVYLYCDKNRTTNTCRQLHEFNTIVQNIGESLYKKIHSLLF